MTVNELRQYLEGLSKDNDVVGNLEVSVHIPCDFYCEGDYNIKEDNIVEGSKEGLNPERLYLII